MELGFGAVLDRFEKAFGKYITNAILGLMGLATAIVCCSIIWKLALGPAFGWLSTLSPTIDDISQTTKVVVYAGAFSFGFWLSSFATARFERRKVILLRAQIDRILEERKALEEELREIEEALDRAGV